MYNVMNIQVPTNPVEAEQVVRTFVKDYNGGFHPDDSGAEIVGPNGLPVFDKENAAHYDRINQACWEQLGEHYWDILLIIGDE